MAYPVYLAAPAYHQVVLCDRTAPSPYIEDWTEREVRQGFAWRPGAVAVATLADSGLMAVTVAIADPARPATPRRTDARRALVVPFTVGARGVIAVSDLNDEREVAVAPGTYALRVELGAGTDPPWWCQFTFMPDPAPRAALLLIDRELRPHWPLVLAGREQE